MKKLLLVFLLGLSLYLIVGCHSEYEDFDVKREINIIEIDGCEYIYIHSAQPWASGFAFSLTHKGNCKNPIHMYNKIPATSQPDSSGNVKNPVQSVH
jgi:hypothetical protein